MRQKNKLSPKYFLFGFTIYITVLLTGCSKTFTSSKDALLGQPAATQFWKTASDAASAVNSIYGNLRTWNNTAFAAIAVESMGADDAIKGSTSNDATFFNQYDNFTVDASEGQLDGFWTGQYQNINYCNQVLDHVDTMAAVDASLKARYLAEAKFVRAYSYFRLVRAFGKIPLVLKVPLSAAELNPKQSTAAEVYAAIEQDLTDAASVLPTTYGAADIGRATKGAALGLHAKVAMYQKKWSDVLTYTNQVIGLGVYSLFSNYYQLFRYANENSSESLFEIQCDYVPGNDDLNSSQYSQVQGDRDASPSAGWGFNIPTDNLASEFEANDPRLQGTIMYAGTTTPSGDAVPQAAAGAPTRYNMKSYVPFAIAVLSGNQGCGQNVRVLRYADVLLMNAEANNELGNTTPALASLELVRARARANSSSPSTALPAVSTTDQTSLRTAIYHERRVELAMENDRYFDVIRQGRAAAVFGSLGWTANKNEVWPIPQTEIDISGGVLVQNTGY
ncbi:MAG TPA: RagB/SusD family nutrient uptake outer membrane protein [Puia sp.]|nr:RagB/SusD family nutrient uptake outer membrane protein [Puia sp.]